MPHECGNAVYHDDGSVEIFIHPSGMPEVTAIMPAPHQTEAEREATHQHNMDAIALHGHILVSAKRVKNEMFDKQGEKTSWQYVYRMPKNEDEAKALNERIKVILARGKKMEGCYAKDVQGQSSG